MNKQETYQYLKDHNIPFENTATVWLQGDDLVTLLRENGCEVEIVEI